MSVKGLSRRGQGAPKPVLNLKRRPIPGRPHPYVHVRSPHGWSPEPFVFHGVKAGETLIWEIDQKWVDEARWKADLDDDFLAFLEEYVLKHHVLQANVLQASTRPGRCNGEVFEVVDGWEPVDLLVQKKYKCALPASLLKLPQARNTETYTEYDKLPSPLRDGERAYHEFMQGAISTLTVDEDIAQIVGEPVGEQLSVTLMSTNSSRILIDDNGTAVSAIGENDDVVVRCEHKCITVQAHRLLLTELEWVREPGFMNIIEYYHSTR